MVTPIASLGPLVIAKVVSTATTPPARCNRTSTRSTAVAAANPGWVASEGTIGRKVIGSEKRTDTADGAFASPQLSCPNTRNSSAQYLPGHHRPH